MCAPDPNAGIRYQAKLEKQKKDNKYHSDSLKYWNRETSHKMRSNALARGLSRARSDSYSKALWVLGKGRQANQEIYKKKSKLSRVSQNQLVGRSNRYMQGKYKDLLAEQSKIESSINSTFGRNMDVQWQGIQRQHMNYVKKNREKLGLRPEYGAPVMMPPKDTAGQFFNSVSMGLSMASTVLGFMALSDIKEKENLKQIGNSPLGHNIYEFNYKGSKQRYKGVIAQEVLLLDPMAVGIMSDGRLGVYYDKIDVDMEKVA